MLIDSTHDQRNIMLLNKKGGGGDPSPRTALSAAEFKKKVQTLKKQIYELLTLCDVPGCLIIQSPDCSQTYTWPESCDDVRRVLKLHTSKLDRGKKAHKVESGRCGVDFCCESVHLFEKRLDGMSVDEKRKRRFLRQLDDKIDSLRKRIQLAKGGSGVESVGTCKDLERLLVDGRTEDESSKYPRDFERVVVALMKRLDSETLSKRKFGSLVENRTDGDRGEVEGDWVAQKLQKVEFESNLASESNRAENRTLKLFI